MTGERSVSGTPWIALPAAVAGSAVIGDARHAGIRLLDHFDFDIAIIAAVFDRVVEQIRKRLLDAQRIAAHDRLAAD